MHYPLTRFYIYNINPSRYMYVSGFSTIEKQNIPLR